MPEYIKGVINLRGRIVLVMDLRTRFGLDKREYDDRTCVIIVNIENTSIGLIVDTVAEVQDIYEKDIEPPPSFKSERVRKQYISGLGKVGSEVKILLDVSKILFKEDMEKIKSSA